MLPFAAMARKSPSKGMTPKVSCKSTPLDLNSYPIRLPWPDVSVDLMITYAVPSHPVFDALHEARATERDLIYRITIATYRFFAVLLLLMWAVPRVESRVWWVRLFDFPRVQLACVGLFLIGVYFICIRSRAWFDRGATLGVVAVTVMHGLAIAPYTPLYNLQMRGAPPSSRSGSTLSLVAANVLMTNRNTAPFVRHVRKLRPDLVLVLEPDAWWMRRLDQALSSYKHRLRKPLDNTYGIALYSKLKLLDADILFLVNDDVPSVRARVELPSGQHVLFMGLHPKPPAPQEASSSLQRDAELIVAAYEARDSRIPVVVAGDLNDVSWSETTRQFQELGGLLDPRRGRGLFSTFHTNNVLLHFPLDQVFASADFRLANLEVLSSIGSDHLPLLVSFVLAPGAVRAQDAPDPEKEDLREAHDTLDEASETSFDGR